LALIYTRRWLHIKSEDPWINRIAAFGSTAMVLVSFVLVLLKLLDEGVSLELLLAASASACFLTIVLTGICAWRAALMGDELAVWIAPAALALTTTLAGLYAQAAQPGILTLPLVSVTAFSAVAYLTIIAALSIVRTRQAKRLERLAGLHLGLDPTTGLPTGSALMAKVSDAFWRASRNGMACNVVCMHLHNLYDLGDLAGHGVEQQIALAMSARIRRALGFRCVVGLYHARCFIAVIQVPQESSAVLIERFVQRLRYLISKPMHVDGHAQTHHRFTPEWGISVVSTAANEQDSSAVLRKAEREAMRATQPAALSAA
jgi:GGDEF domain-containing protein